MTELISLTHFSTPVFQFNRMKYGEDILMDVIIFTLHSDRASCCLINKDLMNIVTFYTRLAKICELIFCEHRAELCDTSGIFTGAMATETTKGMTQ